VFDLLVKGGTLVNGTGAPPTRADVGIVGDRVTAVGALDAEAATTIDAEGRFVTPGFVDIHTHLDAQIMWDPLATSSCWHGVTSLVLGSCGVTFAPCRPEDRGYLAGIMETVEEIPAATIMEGMAWDWESYGDYLEALGRRPKGMNVGGMVGHSAIRWYVMGERSLGDEPATDDEVAAMCALVDEAMAAGALGFSTSRSVGHRVPDGRNTPGTWADPSEMLAIADVLGQHGKGIFELAPRLGELDAPELAGSRVEMAWMAEATRRSGRPLTFALAQNRAVPQFHAALLGLVDEHVAEGALLRPQTTARCIGMLFGLQNRTPFDGLASWGALHGLSLDERVAALAYPTTRAALLAEANEMPRLPMRPATLFLVGSSEATYAYGDDDSLAAHAERAGETVAETFVRVALETEGRALWIWPFLNQTMAGVEQMLDHEQVVLGLGDSGAHVGTIMDASWPTFFLSHWVRDTGKFSIEEGVRRLTSEPADLFSLGGRGRLEVGSFADLNVFDLTALALPTPEYVNDFPCGAGRYVQRASGYDHTVVNGQVFMTAGEHTGAHAGSVLRP
jgi:N-acyl-D-amino-acid deacylase